MVKQFKGQTKVADVQAAFDDIVTKINNLVTSYNAQSFVEEIDYTVGGTTLAPSGYTLTVGGYKQFLKACEGVVTGCKPIKVDDNHFKVTTGMLVGSLGIFRLPDEVLAIPTSTTYRTLYYNTVSKTYEWVRTGHSVLVEKTGHIGCILEKVEGSNAYQYPSSISPIMFNQCGVWDSGGYPWTIEYKEYIDSTKIKLDIGNFKLLSNGILEIGDTIKLLNPDHNMQSGGSERDQISGLIFGYLDSDGETFTPRFGFRNHFAGSGNGVNLWTDFFYNTSLSNRKTGTANVNFSNYIMDGYWITNEWYGFSIVFSKNNDQEQITLNQLAQDGSVIKTTTGNIPDAMNIETNYVNCVLIGNAQYEGNIYPTQYQWIKSSGATSSLNTEGQDYTYYDVVIEPAESISYRVCDINPNCTSKYIGTVHNAQVEDIDGTYEITNETKDYSGYWNSWADWNTDSAPWYEKVDTSGGPNFVIGMPSCTGGGSKHGVGSNEYAYLLGEEVYMMCGQRDRAGISYCPSTWLYVPKGVSNPYTYYSGYHNSNDPKWSKQKVLDVEIERDIEDTSG